MKNPKISDEELLDMGCSKTPELIITDETLFDLIKEGINVQ